MTKKTIQHDLIIYLYFTNTSNRWIFKEICWATDFWKVSRTAILLYAYEKLKICSEMKAEYHHQPWFRSWVIISIDRIRFHKLWGEGANPIQFHFTTFLQLLWWLDLKVGSSSWRPCTLKIVSRKRNVFFKITDFVTAWVKQGFSFVTETRKFMAYRCRCFVIKSFDRYEWVDRIETTCRIY